MSESQPTSVQLYGVVRSYAKREDKMKERFSDRSMLRNPQIPPNERVLWGVLHDSERRIASMCRVMQVYRENACDSIKNLEQDHEELGHVLETFYEFIDSQMESVRDLINDLDHGLHWVSVDRLHESEEFGQRPKNPGDFANSEAYLDYCKSRNIKPISGFNEAFGEAVSSANIRAARQ